MKGDRRIYKDDDHVTIIEVIGYGIYGPDNETYFKFLYPESIYDCYGHSDYLWGYEKLEDSPDKIENMKEGDFYKNKETNDVVMVVEMFTSKCLVKMKFVLANGSRHQVNDEIWFDTRIVDSRYEKL